MEPTTDRDAGGLRLVADCGSCVGLCCVATGFSRSADFAIDKPADTPCPHLSGDDSCSVHATLRERGFGACTVYDCFGAGQRVTQETYAGAATWRSDPATAAQMFSDFAAVRVLHEVLWLLDAALALPAAASLRDELAEAVATTDALAGSPAGTLTLDRVEEQRARLVPLLRRAGLLARMRAPGPRQELAGRDLFGADLRGTDLRGASLRGALLVGADLRDADLTLCDLTGADLRAADVRGADLSAALFLTGAQVASARGDARTRLPAGRAAPGHWPAAGA